MMMTQFQHAEGDRRHRLLAELVAAVQSSLSILDELDDLPDIGARLQNIIDDLEAEMAQSQGPPAHRSGLRTHRRTD
jgi:hypothetical protein